MKEEIPVLVPRNCSRCKQDHPTFRYVKSSPYCHVCRAQIKKNWRLKSSGRSEPELCWKRKAFRIDPLKNKCPDCYGKVNYSS